MYSTSQRSVLYLLGFLAVGFLFAITPVTEYLSGQDFDGRYYAAIAQSFAGQNLELPHLTRIAPWCWRILSPLVASYLPGSVIDQFRLLNLLSCCGCVVLLIELGSALGLSLREVTLALLFYLSLFWSVKFNAYSPCYIDAQLQLFTLAVLLAAVRGWYLMIPGLLMLGAFQKESILFLAPVVFVQFGARNGFTRTAKLYFFVLVVAPLLVLGLLRATIIPLNVYSPEAALRIVFFSQITTPTFWPRFLLEIFSGTGLLLLVLIMERAELARYLRREWYWLIFFGLGVVQFFSGVDKARLMIPLLAPLAIITARSLRSRLSTPTIATTQWLSGTLVLQLALQHQLRPIPTHDEFLATMVEIHTKAPLSIGFIRLGIMLGLWMILTIWYLCTGEKERS